MVKFLKTRNVKNPAREPGNVGFDFFIPEYDEAFERDFAAKNPELKIEKPDATHEHYFVRIPPHKSICVPSGIHSLLPENEALIASNKSGVALKKQLVRGAELIDPNYTGEIHLHLINTSGDFREVNLGDKLVQFIPFVFDNDMEIIEIGPNRNDKIKVETDNGTVEQIPAHDDFDMEVRQSKFYKDLKFNNRSAGAFGSTGIR